MMEKDNIFDELTDFLNSEEGKKSVEEFFGKINQEKKILNSQLKRFHKKFDYKFKKIVNKVIKKYNSDNYKNRWYNRGIEPPEHLYWFLYDYAKKYGRKCSKKEWKKQGSVIAFLKPESHVLQTWEYVNQRMFYILVHIWKRLQIMRSLLRIDKFLFFMHSYNSKQIKSIINRINRIKIESVKSQDFEGAEMLRNVEKHFIKLSNTNPKFLVRPHDHHIFELDETNGCYRSYMCRNVTRQDGTRPNAQNHFTLENLTNNYGFFPIDENQILQHERLNKLHHEFLSWQCRPDGHGGSKGGTMEEFLSKK